MKKKIFLIWDLDGGIGQINSTFPYNYNFQNLYRELEGVERTLDLLSPHKIKCTFAVTGFSGEEGIYPYTFPDLIRKIAEEGHEVASHSWRHEWIPLFKKEQIQRSLARSKQTLERVISKPVVGFVPPHNRPMSWLSRGAYSLGDRGLYPFFTMGDMDPVIKLTQQTGYEWIRIVHHPLWSRKILKTGRIYSYSGLKILENHYTGFDTKVIDYILNSKDETHTISAHPLMLSLKEKKESWSTFEYFIAQLIQEDIQFCLPGSSTNE